jgi:diguanylate cyclase
VARLGGDEFGVLLPGVRGVDDAHLLLAGMRATLERDCEVNGLPLAVEASVGFAVTPHDGNDADELLQHADVAMYVAKAEHGGVVRYDAADDSYDAAELSLVGDLRRAIANEELRLHFQPKVALASGEVVALEALIRWEHPTRGLLYPDAFIPMAEQTGLIDLVTGWVLRRALAQLNEWGSTASGLAVAVNISARNLSRPDFDSVVLGALSDAEVAPHRLLLEITETALLHDPLRASGVLRRLSLAGVLVSLDDFGKGQTSLGYLSELPIHEVKIDKSFVMDMLDREAHAAIVRSIIELAHNLGFNVVAEGVETWDVLDELAGLGCDIAQGFLLTRALSADAVPQWLAEHPISVRPVGL